MRAELARWAKQLAELPEPISYIVANPAAVGLQEGRDGKGRRWVQINSSVLDGLPRAKSQPSGLDAGVSLYGIPVIPAETLPDNWWE